jgi:hypothetical protein
MSSLLGWVGGYLVDPAFLGFFTPFILLPIFIAPVIIFIMMLAGLKHPSNRNRKNYVACFFASIALGFLFSPYRPTSVDGFYYRMSKIDRQVYLAAAELVIAEAERMRLSSNSFNYPVTKEHKDFVVSLSGKNTLFTLSNWPVHISREEDYVLFSWGSGLTGAYEVLITVSNKEPYWLKNHPHATKKIYDNVVLLMN